MYMFKIRQIHSTVTLTVSVYNAMNQKWIMGVLFQTGEQEIQNKRDDNKHDNNLMQTIANHKQLQKHAKISQTCSLLQAHAFIFSVLICG